MFGYKPSKPDERDFRYSMFAEPLQAFPDEYIVPNLPPIYDQGQYPMCVAFGIASIKEHQELTERGVSTRYSPGFIYGNRTSAFEGMEPREALQHLKDEGVCTFQQMPTVDKLFFCKNYIAQYKNMLMGMAEPQKIMSYVRLNTAEEMMSALIKWGMIGIGITVKPSFQRTGLDGIVPASSTSESILGGHWLDVAGWKTINGKKYWVILNSWGTSWGDQGKCYIPFDYPEIVECWGITDAKVTKMDTTAIIDSQNRTLVPLRFFAEALGANVVWDETAKKVTAQFPVRTEPLVLECVIGSDEIKVGEENV